MAMGRNVFDIIRLTPKTNCGECGEPTCMAFATKCATMGLDIGLCPYIEPEKAGSLDLSRSSEEKSQDQDPETALLKELREKIKGVDFAAVARDLGAEVVSQAGQEGESRGGELLRMPFLGKVVQVSRKRISMEGGGELDPRDQILIYNYIFFGGRGEPTGQWVGLESFPNSISKVSTLRRYTEDVLAQSFGSSFKTLRTLLPEVGAVEVAPCTADLCFVVNVLPKLALRFQCWEEDRDEGFPARVKVLFDSRAIEFLDLESLVFAAERVVETLTRR